MKFAVAAVTLLIALPAHAQERPHSLEAARPWTRPAAAGMNGAGYLTLVNHGAKADALVGVETAAAKAASLHNSSMAGGVMRMAPESQVTVPAHGQVAFAPGGRHLMFEGLTRALQPGDKIPATLRFASGARLKVEFPVRTAAPTGAAHDMSMDHGDHMNHGAHMK